MGYDPCLFINDVSDEFKCPICFKVFEEPVSGNLCDHIYCSKCISKWLKQSSKCPLDRVYLRKCFLRPAPKIVVNVLKKLEMKCPQWELGCCWVLKLGDLSNHQEWCLFRSSSAKPSSAIIMPINTLKQMRIISDKTIELSQLKDKIEQLKYSFENHKKCSGNISDSINTIKNSLNELNKTIKNATDPLVELFLNDKELSELKVKEDKEDTVTVLIRNLNEFMNTNLLIEYLRQNNIYVVKCETELNHWQRSKDFRVTIPSSLMDKILSPKLWPKGVSVHVNSKKFKNYVTFGDNGNESSIKIESGITYW